MLTGVLMLNLPQYLSTIMNSLKSLFYFDKNYTNLEALLINLLLWKFHLPISRLILTLM